MNKFSAIVFALVSALPAGAALPTVDEPNWTSTFAAFENRNLRFQLFEDGNIVVHPLFKDKKVFPYVRIPVKISLEEMLPNGGTRVHELDADSLDSPDKPTLKLKSTTVRGKFAEGTTFELVAADNRGEVALEARLTQPASGTASTPNIRILITAEVLNFYGRDEQKLGADSAEFRDLVSKSTLSYQTAERKKAKLDFRERLPDGGSEKNLEVGQAVTHLDIAGGKQFEFTAEGASMLRLSPRNDAPLHRGFFASWGRDAGARPADSASFRIDVK